MTQALKKIWLDTDPGFDDWLTMLLLGSNPDIEWLGVSVVAGNAPVAIDEDLVTHDPHRDTDAPDELDALPGHEGSR